MMLRAWINRARRNLGGLGMAAVVIAVAAIALNAWGLRPLEERGRQVEMELDRKVTTERASGAEQMRNAGPAAKLAAFYAFFDQGERPAQSLAKLDRIARESGVEMKSAEYRMQRSGSRIERYEITLPLNAGYAQIRTFMDRALQEIPALSLDQVSFKRNHGGEQTVRADLRMTLHVLAGQNQAGKEPAAKG